MKSPGRIRVSSVSDEKTKQPRIDRGCFFKFRFLSFLRRIFAAVPAVFPAASETLSIVSLLFSSFEKDFMLSAGAGMTVSGWNSFAAVTIVSAMSDPVLSRFFRFMCVFSIFRRFCTPIFYHRIIFAINKSQIVFIYVIKPVPVSEFTEPYVGFLYFSARYLL